MEWQRLKALNHETVAIDRDYQCYAQRLDTRLLRIFVDSIPGHTVLFAFISPSKVEEPVELTKFKLFLKNQRINVYNRYQLCDNNDWDKFHDSKTGSMTDVILRFII